MPNFTLTPILFHYNYLEDLCSEVASILKIDKKEEEKYLELKISVFLNFNRYLSDYFFSLEEKEMQDLSLDLTKAMETANEKETLDILSNKYNILAKKRSEFLEIIKNVK
jgi:hypothetical protein